MTIAPDLLRTLSKMNEPVVDVTESSIFKQEMKAHVKARELTGFVNDETKYREAFAQSYGGKGLLKTMQVRLNEFQHARKCEMLNRS